MNSFISWIGGKKLLRNNIRVLTLLKLKGKIIYLINITATIKKL